jgi:hypothetical protein
MKERFLKKGKSEKSTGTTAEGLGGSCRCARGMMKRGSWRVTMKGKRELTRK